jgi:hypothetical protein
MLSPQLIGPQRIGIGLFASAVILALIVAGYLYASAALIFAFVLLYAAGAGANAVPKSDEKPWLFK